MISKSDAIAKINEFGAYISVRDLAEILGRDRSRMLKLVKKYGFNPIGYRSEDHGNQEASFLTARQAAEFVESWMGGMVPGDDDDCIRAIAECKVQLRGLQARYRQFEEITDALQAALDRLECVRT